MSRVSSLSVSVLGDGGWGTTLAMHLDRRGHRVTWWSASPEYAVQLARRRENPRYLPGVNIPRRIRVTSDLAEATGEAALVVVAVPSQFLRNVVRRVTARPSDQLLVSVAKGLETTSLKRMSEVICEELPGARVVALSGPNIASEIAHGQPASSVAASSREADATRVQSAFSDDRLRVYTSSDIVGVELGGALKNPIAIAAGIGDGLGLGSNAKAALITRGVVEMARLGVVLGARRETFSGLSGLGDLITTCMGGRNRGLGEQLGAGKSLRQILAGSAMVIEGVETSKAAVALGKAHGVELPIIEQVYAVLFRRRSPQHALQSLMRRPHKPEAAA